MNYLLIVEDDKALGEGLRLALESPEREIVLRQSLSGARKALAEWEFDLIILDVNLPDGSGMELLPRSGTPVILLTANDLEANVVAGLEAGADDYITKPFSLAVLRARVNAQLRRKAEESRPLVLGIFSFDFPNLDFRVYGIPVELSRTEQRLLRVLVEERGKTLPREVLIEKVWPDSGGYVDANALSVAVRRLRDKLEDNPSKPKYLKTVYGVGYTWAVVE